MFQFKELTFYVLPNQEAEWAICRRCAHKLHCGNLEGILLSVVWMRGSFPKRCKFSGMNILSLQGSQTLSILAANVLVTGTDFGNATLKILRRRSPRNFKLKVWTTWRPIKDARIFPKIQMVALCRTKIDDASDQAFCPPYYYATRRPCC